MTVLNIEQIMAVLPHRYPMLLVDKVIECDDKQRIVGLKNVTINEPFFQGHFPGFPVMPGVLQVEAMAQTGGILISRIMGAAKRLPFFMTIDNVKFRRPVKPGDQLRIEVDLTNLRSRSAKFTGKIFVGGALVSEAELMCMLTDEQLPA